MLVVFVVVHLFLFFIYCYSSFCCCFSFISRLPCHFTGTPPWLLRPVKASTSSELYPNYFDCLLCFNYYERYGFEWAFFTHRHFLPYAPSPTFYLCLLRLPWEPAVLPWSLQGFMLIFKTQTRPICLLDSQQSTIFIFRTFSFKILPDTVMNHFRTLFACSKRI